MRFACYAALAIALSACPVAAASVAVLDTGVDASHPELSGRVERESFVATGALPIPELVEDPDGQGTAVASLVAGRTLGIAPDETLLDLQVVSPFAGTGVDASTEEAAVAALDWVLSREEPPRTVLLSFAAGGLTGPGAETLAAQAQRLWDQGVLVVAPMAGSPSALTSSPHVLAVGGLSSCQAVAQGEGPPKPDLVAPAEGLPAASPSPPIGSGGTTSVSGTAYAAAQAAGAAAAMFQGRPSLPVDAAAAILRGTATAGDACAGAGVLDPEAAIEAAAAWNDPLSQPTVRDAVAPVAALAVAVVLALAGRVRRHA